MSAVVSSSKNFAGFSSNRTKKSNKKLSLTPPKASVYNPHLFNINHSGSKVVTYRNLFRFEPEYDDVSDMITNENLVIENIVKVYNPFLETAYNLKKSQKRTFYGINKVREEFLFHGTKKENVNSICTFNFDWRLNGQNTGHKFGKGVSFTASDTYASHYCDADSYHKVMIVAKVLIASACVGYQEMIVPPPYFDTSKKGDGMVVVKYEDNEFLPMYKLYYHLDEDYDDYYDEDDEYDDNYYYNYYF